MMKSWAKTAEKLLYQDDETTGSANASAGTNGSGTDYSGTGADETRETGIDSPKSRNHPHDGYSADDCSEPSDQRFRKSTPVGSKTSHRKAQSSPYDQTHETCDSSYQRGYCSGSDDDEGGISDDISDLSVSVQLSVHDPPSPPKKHITRGRTATRAHEPRFKSARHSEIPGPSTPVPEIEKPLESDRKSSYSPFEGSAGTVSLSEDGKGASPSGDNSVSDGLPAHVERNLEPEDKEELAKLKKHLLKLGFRATHVLMEDNEAPGGADENEPSNEPNPIPTSNIDSLDDQPDDEKMSQLMVQRGMGTSGTHRPGEMTHGTHDEESHVSSVMLNPTTPGRGTMRPLVEESTNIFPGQDEQIALGSLKERNPNYDTSVEGISSFVKRLQPWTILETQVLEESGATELRLATPTVQRRNPASQALHCEPDINTLAMAESDIRSVMNEADNSSHPMESSSNGCPTQVETPTADDHHEETNEDETSGTPLAQCVAAKSLPEQDAITMKRKPSECRKLFEDTSTHSHRPSEQFLEPEEASAPSTDIDSAASMEAEQEDKHITQEPSASLADDETGFMGNDEAIFDGDVAAFTASTMNAQKQEQPTVNTTATLVQEQTLALARESADLDLFFQVHTDQASQDGRPTENQEVVVSSRYRDVIGRLSKTMVERLSAAGSPTAARIISESEPAGEVQTLDSLVSAADSPMAARVISGSEPAGEVQTVDSLVAAQTFGDFAQMFEEANACTSAVDGLVKLDDDEQLVDFAASRDVDQEDDRKLDGPEIAMLAVTHDPEDDRKSVGPEAVTYDQEDHEQKDKLLEYRPETEMTEEAEEDFNSRDVMYACSELVDHPFTQVETVADIVSQQLGNMKMKIDMPSISTCDAEEDKSIDGSISVSSELPKANTFLTEILQILRDDDKDIEQGESRHSDQQNPSTNERGLLMAQPGDGADEQKTNRRQISRTMYFWLPLLCLAFAAIILCIILGVRHANNKEVNDIEGAGVGAVGSSPSPVPRPTAFPSISPVLVPSPSTDETIPPTNTQIPAVVVTSVPGTLAPTQGDVPDTTDQGTATVIPGGGCSDSITTDARCYADQTAMFIAFENCDPLGDDWVGIYPFDSDPQNLGNPSLWVWTCGTTDCFEPRTTSAFPLSQDLPTGIYKAFLVRRKSGGPYSSYASSAEFRIVDAGVDCEQLRQ